MVKHCKCSLCFRKECVSLIFEGKREHKFSLVHDYCVAQIVSMLVNYVSAWSVSSERCIKPPAMMN